MPDPISLGTSFIPARLKEKLADSFVELLAGSAESLGGDQIASKIRKLSSRNDLLQSVDRALEAGSQRFIKEYMGQDEDLVEAIRDDASFWQSEMVQDALVRLVSRPGAWLHEEREAVAYHFETILPRRVNRERVDRAINFLLRCIAEELWSLPGAQEIRAAYSIQFQELSAEAQREQVGLARQQLQATTQMSAGLQQALLQLIGLVEQKVLAAPAPVAMLASPRPYHNLPQPTYTQFVGRDEELAWLRQRLSPADRAWQIAITGIGGVGKSALALAVAWEYQRRYNDLPSEERFEAIVWVSAKEEVLTAFGRERANVPEQVLHTLEDVYTAIARVLEREDITRAQPQEQNALVEKALRRQRTLLIMDNLESVKDDRIRAFLRNLPSPTKAIITSRESLDVADVRPLTGLRWEEAEALIEEDCRVREVTLTLQQRTRIFELTSGLPLPIKLGIARMAGGESFATVERWLGDAVGELPEYCVKGQIDLVRQRDPNAWTVLLACALFDREAGASRQALGEISDLSLADRDVALSQLQRLFLISTSGNDRFRVLPIVQRFAAAELTVKAVAGSLVPRWARWLADFAQSVGRQADRSGEKLWETRQEIPTLRAAIYWCRDNKYHKELLKLCDGTWPYLYLVGLLNDLDETLRIWLDVARTEKSELAEGLALLQMGRLSHLREQNTAAIEYFDQTEPILERHEMYTELAEAWATRCQIHVDQKMYADALAQAQRIRDLGLRLKASTILLLAADLFAFIDTLRGNPEKALDWTTEGLLLAQKADIPGLLAGMLYNRARTLTMMKQYSEAERLLDDALRIDVPRQARRYIALDKLQLAKVYAATGRISAARQLAFDARELAQSMGLAGYLVEIDCFVASLSGDQ